MDVKMSQYFGEMWKRSRLMISHSGFAITDDTWKQKPVPSPFSRLYFVCEGSGVIDSGSQQMLLEPGYAYLAPCGSLCGFYGTASVTKLFFHINVTMPNGYDLFGSCKEFMRIPIPVSYIHKLRDWYLSQDVLKQTMLKCSIWGTISEFAEKLYPEIGESVNYSDSVKKAIDYIQKNLNSALTVNEIANAIFVSRSTLTALFKKELGVTVARYTEDLIMQEAQWLLLDSNKSIYQIGEELGFCDQFYFSRRFSRHFHMTPSDYRKNRAVYVL